jgi:hypothetical protein
MQGVKSFIYIVFLITHIYIDPSMLSGGKKMFEADSAKTPALNCAPNFLLVGIPSEALFR